MIRILICDDEGIVQESIRFIIQKSLGAECELESARNGRVAIELAETFRPDIVLMDIQMPGINGIEAMQQIRRENKNIVFIVLTAYDKFEYTKKSIEVGVLAYLTKPIKRDLLLEKLRKAMRQVQNRREKVSHDLKVKEKLEAVIPIIENGFVYNVLLESNEKGSNLGYRELLNIDTQKGYVMVIECGDEFHKGQLSNTVGAGIKLQKHYMVFRETVKEATEGIVGALMANKVIVLIPCEVGEESYEERVLKIENARSMLRKLEQQIELRFKVGIGSVKVWDVMSESYKEARDTVQQGVGKVIHAKDLPVSCIYEETYPIELEKELFAVLERGNVEETEKIVGRFVAWMDNSFTEVTGAVRLKTIEFVLWAEHLAYNQGGMVYRFTDREGYMETVAGLETYEELENWFVRKMADAGRHIAMRQQERTGSVVDKAKAHIRQHFLGDLSLEAIAKEVGISPYYLSKLFKESEGVNYIDYVTKLRINYAKERLSGSDRSVKEVCYESGYSDPNYFSRIFKKWVGVTPTEFREGGTVS